MFTVAIWNMDDPYRDHVSANWLRNGSVIANSSYTSNSSYKELISLSMHYHPLLIVCRVPLFISLITDHKRYDCSIYLKYDNNRNFALVRLGNQQGNWTCPTWFWTCPGRLGSTFVRHWVPSALRSLKVWCFENETRDISFSQFVY